MVRQERWEEIRRLAFRERVPIAEIARRLDLDRKTVRRCLRDTEWTAYRRSPRADTLLAPHAVNGFRASWPPRGALARDGHPFGPSIPLGIVRNSTVTNTKEAF